MRLHSIASNQNPSHQDAANTPGPMASHAVDRAYPTYGIWARNILDLRRSWRPKITRNTILTSLRSRSGFQEASEKCAKTRAHSTKTKLESTVHINRYWFILFALFRGTLHRVTLIYTCAPRGIPWFPRPVVIWSSLTDICLTNISNNSSRSITKVTLLWGGLRRVNMSYIDVYSLSLLEDLILVKKCYSRTLDQIASIPWMPVLVQDRTRSA